MLLQGHLLFDAAQRPVPGWLEISSGRIAALGEGKPPSAPDLGGPTAVICPAFIDAHLHLPQFTAIGIDGLELLPWLERAIYPAEERWADPSVARRDLRLAYTRLLEVGTVGFAGYLTSHTHATNALRDLAEEVPLRAIAGQVLMDRNAPIPLIDQTISPLISSPDGRMTASVNPRFAIACSDTLLARAGASVTDQTFVQTHLAESADECKAVARLFPDDPTYTAVYDRHGLLTPRTLLAHCLHLGEPEWSLISARRAVVVHCPGANTFLRSGLFDLRSAREHGIRLALGSDVAAGPDLAMPRVARAMIEVAKLRLSRSTPAPSSPAPPRHGS